MKESRPAVVQETQTPEPAAAPAAPASLWDNPVLKFFCSVHVAVVTLILLAAISIIGTVLQQENIADVGDNLRLFQQFFGDAGRAQRAFDISERMGLFHLYQTWYFYALLGVLSTSLILCSLKRLPQTWRIMARPKVELEESGFTSSQNRRTLALRLPPAEAAAAVSAILAKAGYRVRDGERDGARHLFGQKGAYSRLGIYTTHFSIIIIFVGGILGSIFGFKGYMQITEGEAEDQYVLRGAGKEVGKLPFQVRCDDFTVDYYPGSSRPKDFYSQLTVLDGGKEVLKEKIEVNSPLKYGGVWFYQSSYGDTGRGMTATIRAVDPKSGAAQDLKFTDRSPQTVPGTGIRVQLQQIYPDFAMDENRKPTTRSNQPRNPVAQVAVELPGGQSWLVYLFKLRPDLKTARDLPLDLRFTDIESVQYTGLQVVHDPGVWVIWTGCTLMVLGLWFAFFVSHRRVWVRLREEGGRTAVAFAGNANKNRESFSEEFEKLGDAVQAVAEARA
ncbi:MAG TPA: cytochrome c biogenesis protein ResB [Candidatus Methanoperedens sp.]|nr:cytochrome c biogenesis protein ResB [Candidatus Methanoperedens sp.]